MCIGSSSHENLESEPCEHRVACAPHVYTLTGAVCADSSTGVACAYSSTGAVCEYSSTCGYCVRVQFHLLCTPTVLHVYLTCSRITEVHVYTQYQLTDHHHKYDTRGAKVISMHVLTFIVHQLVMQLLECDTESSLPSTIP